MVSHELRVSESVCSGFSITRAAVATLTLSTVVVESWQLHRLQRNGPVTTGIGSSQSSCLPAVGCSGGGAPVAMDANILLTVVCGPVVGVAYSNLHV